MAQELLETFSLIIILGISVTLKTLCMQRKAKHI